MKYISIAFVFLVAACSGGAPVPPAPNSDFVLKSKSITVEGKMKPGAKATAAELKAAVNVTLKALEP